MTERILQIVNINTLKVNTDLFNITAINRNNDPYWVEFIEPYFDEIGVKIQILPFENLDLSKKWFINVDINGWNWESFSGNPLETFDTFIINELLIGNAYLILNHQCESFTKSFLNLLYRKNKKIPYNKIIYMVGAADIEREYDQFVIENSIGPTDRLNVMYVHHVYKRFKNLIDLKTFQCVPTEKTKKYLSLNRRWRDHRLMLTSLLSYRNLLDQGYVSLGVMPEDADDAEFSLRDEFREGFRKFKDRLPLQVDDVDLSINQFQMNSLPIEFYQRSCFSLVSSTMALAKDEGSVGFTEKEVKPILYKHPFIILNRPGVLKHMHNMGFLTFEPWFDESYDKEIDDIKRLYKIVDEVERLCSLSFEQWETIINEMQPVLNHNYNRMVNYTTEHCFFNSDLKKFLYYAQ